MNSKKILIGIACLLCVHGMQAVSAARLRQLKERFEKSIATGVNAENIDAQMAKAQSTIDKLKKDTTVAVQNLVRSYQERLAQKRAAVEAYKAQVYITEQEGRRLEKILISNADTTKVRNALVQASETLIKELQKQKVPGDLFAQAAKAIEKEEWSVADTFNAVTLGITQLDTWRQDNLEGLANAYKAVTGKAGLPEKWSFESVDNEIKATVAALKKAKIDAETQAQAQVAQAKSEAAARTAALEQQLQKVIADNTKNAADLKKVRGLLATANAALDNVHLETYPEAPSN